MMELSDDGDWIDRPTLARILDTWVERRWLALSPTQHRILINLVYLPPAGKIQRENPPCYNEELTTTQTIALLGGEDEEAE